MMNGPETGETQIPDFVHYQERQQPERVQQQALRADELRNSKCPLIFLLDK